MRDSTCSLDMSLLALEIRDGYMKEALSWPYSERVNSNRFGSIVLIRGLGFRYNHRFERFNTTVSLQDYLKGVWEALLLFRLLDS